MSIRPLVVIPTYNNAPTIAEVVHLCLQQFPHVLVVNDGSTDDTGDLAAAVRWHGQRPKVVHHEVNKGKGAAMLTAFEWALEHSYTHAITLDGDMQHRPDEIARFLATAEAQPHTLIVGVRDMSDAPPRSQFARWFSNLWMQIVSGQAVGDSQTGYRVYPLLDIGDIELRGKRYDMEIEVLARASWAGVPIVQVPCDVWYAPKEERQSHFRLGADLAAIILMFARLLAGRISRPSRWFVRPVSAKAPPR